MASIIRLKRSGTSGAPATLAHGELAYSYLPHNDAAPGGDVLYIGTGNETEGAAANIDIIGGKYFTEKLDHAPGILTANSAIIVDANSKIDLMNIGNIRIAENTISTTPDETNLVIDVGESGSIDVSSAKITNLGTPTANTDAVTKAYVDTELSNIVNASNLDIAGDTGSGSIVLESEIFSIVGSEGIATDVIDNTVTISGKDASANTKGIASFDATDFTVSSGNVTLNAERVQDIVASYVIGGTSITVVYDDNANTLTFGANLATTTSLGVASFGGWAGEEDTVRQFEVSNGDVSIVNLDGGDY